MSSGDFRLIVGLGNPGTKYAGTRHNVGFMALEKLAQEEASNFKQQNKLFGLLAEIGVGENRLRLLMPNTFMNDSGKAIKATMDWFGLEVNQLLVIVDDLDLPLGRLRLRTKGSSGGHKGLLSTIHHLGTENFSRLRIGIGAPNCSIQERQMRTISHVLGSFTKEEHSILEDVLSEALIGLRTIQLEGIINASNRINSFCIEKNKVN